MFMSKFSWRIIPFLVYIFIPVHWTVSIASSVVHYAMIGRPRKVMLALLSVFRPD